MIEFRFPDVGEGIVEGEIVKWHVKQGDMVDADQVLLEVETDKAIVEIPSPKKGRILNRFGNEGEKIRVGDVLVVIGSDDEVVATAISGGRMVELMSKQQVVSKNKDMQQIKHWSGVVGELEEASEDNGDLTKGLITGNASVSNSSDQKIGMQSSPLALPAVRKLALSLGVDIKNIKPSGVGAVVTQDDVLVALKSGFKSVSDSSLSPVDSSPSPKLVRKYDLYGYIDHIQLLGIRKVTAKHMVQALASVVPVTHMDDVDVTHLWEIRQKQKLVADKKGVKLTLMPFIIKAVVAGIRQFPILASSLDDVQEEVVVKKYFNIGVAVDIDDGLLVPVIKSVDAKSVLEIAKELQDLVKKAQDRKLDPADLKGGVFTITNIGSIGGTHFTPIVNFPEAAILGVGRMQELPRIVEHQIMSRLVLPLSLTFDHRILDGAQAARFMNVVKEHLEDPDLLLIERD
ncbi:MAG: dihydrolipoamide acetyltransferase family protein [Nanoarchaeota archaeon]